MTRPDTQAGLRRAAQALIDAARARGLTVAALRIDGGVVEATLAESSPAAASSPGGEKPEPW